MTVDSILRTIDLARAAGVSVQQVRNFEGYGFIPAVERSPSGYRRYSRRHLVALTTARRLIGGYGWQRAREIMGAVHGGALAEALALIDARHAELDRTRAQLAQTLATLDLLATRLAPDAGAQIPRRLRVGAAARLVGVRVSALRFWEGQQLLHPVREPGSKYRLYDERQLRRLRIVALLRQSHHDFATIHATLDELEAGRPGRAVAAVERRREELAATSWRCLGALAALHAYLEEFHDLADVDDAESGQGV